MAFSLSAERQPFDRYQSIVDRQMFGQVPADFDPDKMPSEVKKTNSKGEGVLTKEQEKIKSAIKFSCINITPSGETAVGFTDNSDSKNPHHYYLKVGETVNGWELREADAVATTMTIAKGDVIVSLTLGADSGKGGGTTEKAKTSASTASTSRTTTAAEEGTPRQRRMRGLMGRLQTQNDELQKNADRMKKDLEQRKQQDEEQRQVLQAELLDIRDQLRRSAEEARANKERAEKAEAQAEASTSDTSADHTSETPENSETAADGN